VQFLTGGEGRGCKALPRVREPRCQASADSVGIRNRRYSPDERTGCLAAPLLAAHSPTVDVGFFCGENHKLPVGTDKEMRERMDKENTDQVESPEEVESLEVIESPEETASLEETAEESVVVNVVESVDEDPSESVTESAVDSAEVVAAEATVADAATPAPAAPAPAAPADPAPATPPAQPATAPTEAAQTSPQQSHWSARQLATMALFVALGTVLAFIAMPILPLAAGWGITYDPANVPAIIGGLAFGPGAGLVIGIFSAIIHGFLVADPAGAIMNIVVVVGFVTPASMIYKQNKTPLRMILGLIAGAIVSVIIVIPANLIIWPIFYNIPFSVGLEYIVPLMLPFNGLKAAINAVLSSVLYQSLRKLIESE